MKVKISCVHCWDNGDLTIINIEYLGIGSYPAISTHSTIENMEHIANTHDCTTKHAGAFISKHTQSQNHNAPLYLKST